MRNSYLSAARKAFTSRVNLNPSRLTLTRQATTTDPITGNDVQDPSGNYTYPIVTARIQHERATVPENEDSPAGLSSDLERMIMSDYKNEIKTDDVFTWQGLKFKIGKVDPVYQYSGLVGYQAPLIEAG
jgi:hypothetical protein